MTLKKLNPKISPWFKRLLALTAVCYVGLVGLFFYAVLNDQYNDWWFDEKIWKAKAYVDEKDNSRALMIFDLQHRVLKPKMTKKQVMALLGPPERRESDTSISYYIGYGKSLAPGNFDPEIFTIEFDKSDRLVTTDRYIP